jgi:thiamine-phosphate pyrophosphorylase
MRLYALLTERWCARPWRETAGLILEGGADVLQLREKDLPARDLLARARLLRDLTAAAGALLIVNDRPDVAFLSGADGVHLGQDDLPPREARRLLEGGMIVGLSAGSAEEARRAEQDGADYVGVGPVAPTATKGIAEGRGPELVQEVARAVELPVVAIGGIDRANAAAAVRAGATAVAACAALCSADDPLAAARALRAEVEGAIRTGADLPPGSSA